MVLSNFKFHSPLQQSKIQSEEQQKSVLWAELMIQAVLRMEQGGQSFLPSAPASRKTPEQEGCLRLPEPAMDWPVPLMGWLLCFVLLWA